MTDLKEALTYALEHPADPTPRPPGKHHRGPQHRSLAKQDNISPAFPSHLIWTLVGSLAGLSLVGFLIGKRRTAAADNG